MKGEERQIRRNAGLTLIEVLVVMGIVVLLIGLGLLVSMDAFRGYIYRSERLVLVSVLEKARSRAMNNINQTCWGARYDGDNYVIFKTLPDCATEAPGGDTVPANPNATITGFTGVVFSQLRGATTGATITLTENGRAETITVNAEGAIIW